ncbi:uncharacterized protein LOC144422144 [Styela clava]
MCITIQKLRTLSKVTIRNNNHRRIHTIRTKKLQRYFSGSTLTVRLNYNLGELKKLYVGGNSTLGVQGVSQLASVVLQCEVEDVNMSRCKLTAEAMEGFKNNTRGAKLKKLDVGGNREFGVQGVSQLASVVLQCEVEDVNMSECELTAEAMEGFKNNTRGAKGEKCAGNTELGKSRFFLK